MEAIAYRELDELEATHWWYQGMRNITQTILSPVLKGHNNFKMLDAGCGAGGNLKVFEPYGQIVGIDFSQLAVDYANKRHGGKVTQADIRYIPYPDNYFDLVTSFDVIVMLDDDMAAIQEFARVVRPGGHVLVRVAAMPSLRGPHDDVVHSVRRYVAPELRSKLENVGLMPLRLTYANSILMPLIYGIRQVQNRLVGQRTAKELESDVSATARPLNTMLIGLLNVEARWIASGRNFPSGVSLFALATKPKI